VLLLCLLESFVRLQCLESSNKGGTLHGPGEFESGCLLGVMSISLGPPSILQRPNLIPKRPRSDSCPDLSALWARLSCFLEDDGHKESP